MSKPPLQPYPPDLPDEPEEPDLEAGLTDAIVRDVDWANRRVSRASVLRTELHLVRLTGALRGMRMPWNDVLENAPLFAGVVGIEIVD